MSSKVGRNGRGTPECADSLGPNAIVIDEALLAQAPCETLFARDHQLRAMGSRFRAPDRAGPKRMIASPTGPQRHRSYPRLAALAMMGTLLAACGGTVGPSPSPSRIANPTLASDAVPSATSTAAPSTAPTHATPTSAASPAIGQCTKSDIVATAGPLGGAAGSRGADVVVRTSGSASCRLPASPVVAVVDPAGKVLLRNRPSITADGPLISPTVSLSFSFQMSNWCDRSATMPLHFLLALAGGSLDISGLKMAVDDLPPCNGPGQPASLSTTDWAQQ